MTKRKRWDGIAQVFYEVIARSLRALADNSYFTYKEAAVIRSMIQRKIDKSAR